MQLIIYIRSRQAILSSLIATLILIKLPSARHYIITKIQRICHCMICSNKKHIEQQSEPAAEQST